MSRRRDREATQTRLIQALGTVLARDGHAGLGVNAVAREAGVDKVLIYRYFDGLPGLVEAFARSVDFWPSEDELLGADLAELLGLPIEERYARFVRNYIHAIRARPVLREILVWDAVEKSRLTATLDEVRESSAMTVIGALAKDVPRSSDHFFTVLGILGAAIHYFVMISRNTPVFAGIPLQTDEGWARLEEAMVDIVRRGLANSQDPPPRSTS